MSKSININNIKKGERAAFKQFVLSYSSLLFAKSKLYCRNTSDAEDCLQDSFIIIFQKASTFQGFELDAFLAWCLKIVINNALSKYRRKYYSHERDELTVHTDISLNPSIYAELGQQEITKQIDSLPDGYRQIFALHAIDGYKHKEIAKMLDINVTTSRSQYMRAKRQLQDKLNHVLKSYSV